MSQRVRRASGLFAFGSGFFVVAILGCSAIKVSSSPEGRHVITCDHGMKDCIGRAAKLCGKDGYTIVKGSSRPTLLGGSESPNRTMAEVAELEIVCGQVEVPAQEECSPGARPNTVTQPPAEESTPEVKEEQDVNERVCVPGTTQKCVGPGACEGGQSCQSDGKAFGPCDCGGQAPLERSPEGRDRDAAPPKRPSSLEPGKPAPPPSVPAPGRMPAPTPLSP